LYEIKITASIFLAYKSPFITYIFVTNNKKSFYL